MPFHIPVYMLYFLLVYFNLYLHLYFYIFVLRSYFISQSKIYIDNRPIESNIIIVIIIIIIIINLGNNTVIPKIVCNGLTYILSKACNSGHTYFRHFSYCKIIVPASKTMEKNAKLISLRRKAGIFTNYLTL